MNKVKYLPDDGTAQKAKAAICKNWLPVNTFIQIQQSNEQLLLGIADISQLAQ